MIRVTVWNEYRHENPAAPKCKDAAVAMHPNGLHETVAEIVRELGEEQVSVKTA